LILGGFLTGLLGWRWAFFINVPIGLAVLAGSRTLVEAELHKGRPDLTGALSSIIGMAALVYGITRGGEHGWTDGITLIAFATTAILLPLFLVLQSRSSDPLLPLRLFKDRNRSGSYLAMLLLGFGPMGMIYLLTLYLQHILSYSPTLTAMAFLPFGVGIIMVLLSVQSLSCALRRARSQLRLRWSLALHCSGFRPSGNNSTIAGTSCQPPSSPPSVSWERSLRWH